jgi:hypothetical protein
MKPWEEQRFTGVELRRRGVRHPAPDCGLDNAMEIAERLRTAQPEGTCSLGVAQWDGREDVTALVARADRALYAAKDAGRDRIRRRRPDHRGDGGTVESGRCTARTWSFW